MPARLRDFYKTLYSLFAQDYEKADLQFMNYGFVRDDQDSTASTEVPLEPSEEKYRYGTQLYHHVVQGIRLEGKTVLEVGCGRGGGASYIARNFKPKRYTGLDFMQPVIELCTRNNTLPNLDFLVGDAENLPFGEAVFEVVINVESCHCYDPLENFLAGVRRVLVPGGYFLLTDFRDLIGIDELRRAMFRCGMTMLDEKNITRNVLESIKRESGKKSKIIKEMAPEDQWSVLHEFSGLEGSKIYRELENGGAKYMSYILRKI